MTGLFVLLGLASFVSGIWALCNCRDKEKNYRVDVLFVILGLASLFASLTLLGCIFWRLRLGYPIGKIGLAQNAVYEVVFASEDVGLRRRPPWWWLMRYFAPARQ